MRFVKIAENNGWNGLVRGRIHVYPIPGAHLDIFDAAHAPVLAEQVRTSLNQPADSNPIRSVGDVLQGRKTG